MIPFIAEGIQSLLVDKVKNDLDAITLQINTERSDDVYLEPVQYVFTYEGARGYKAPSVWCVIESISFLRKEKQSNFIDAQARAIVSVVVEERNAVLLTLKAHRYQSALFKLFDLQELTSVDGRIKLKTIVDSCEFSPVFSNAKENEEARFRKEVYIVLDVYYYEDYN